MIEKSDLMDQGEGEEKVLKWKDTVEARRYT